MMRSTTLVGVLVAGALTAAAGQAQAQGPAPLERGYVHVNVGGQVGSHDLDQSGTFELYDETGLFAAKTSVGGSPIYDIGGGYRITGKFYAGISLTGGSDTSDSDVTASVPHPFYYDQFRSVSGQATGLKHSETALHLQAVYRQPVTTKFDIALSVGPSFFFVNQDVVSGVIVAEQGVPTTGAVFTGASQEKIKKTGVGFNIGADGTYMFNPRLGAGVFLRYAGASVDLDGTAGTVKLDVGGMQIGAGLRLRF